ncbi:alpha/beta hydrolase family protein [uncultured Jatrophihabitans sp.]|uniref:alpha/beta hydrolase family protein n=1 Tax=uncultured Jatrophihabitans sp. TaxID=1610747 RepID=UPI0035C9751B
MPPPASPDRSESVTLLAGDGVRLAGLHWPAPTRDVGCVVAHGFTGSSRNADVQRICAALAHNGYGVLSPDLRGHGRSAGATTAGADEVHDIAASVRWLRAAGYLRVVVLGWSMGGTSVLRHAGLGGDADAVVSVSAPGTWWERGTRPMRIVHWLFETRTGRVTVRLARRTRVAPNAWEVQPEAPAEVAGAIAPRPLLLVHGEEDHYFPLTHVEKLAAAAPSADVWIEPGMGHAELATTDDLLLRIADWVRTAVGSGQPVCDDVRRD